MATRRVEVTADTLMCAKCHEPMYTGPGNCPHLLPPAGGYIEIEVPDTVTTLALEMEQKAWDYGAGSSARAELLKYAAKVREIEVPDAPAAGTPAVQEQQWEYAWQSGAGNIVGARKAGWEFDASPVGDGVHVMALMRRRVPAPAGETAPEVVRNDD